MTRRLRLRPFPQHVAQMLGVEGMPLREPADDSNGVVVNAFVRSQEAFPDELRPMFLGDRTERIVARGPVQGTRLVEKHLLDQVLAAAQEQIADFGLVLNDASQFAFHQVGIVFQDSLDFVEYDCDAAFFPRGDRGRRLQNFLQLGVRLAQQRLSRS